MNAFTVNISQVIYRLENAYKQPESTCNAQAGMHTSNADLASKEHGFKKSSVVANSVCKRDHGTRKSSRTLLTDQKKKKKKVESMLHILCRPCPLQKLSTASYMHNHCTSKLLCSKNTTNCRRTCRMCTACMTLVTAVLRVTKVKFPGQCTSD